MSAVMQATFPADLPLDLLGRTFVHLNTIDIIPLANVCHSLSESVRHPSAHLAFTVGPPGAAAAAWGDVITPAEEDRWVTTLSRVRRIAVDHWEGGLRLLLRVIEASAKCVREIRVASCTRWGSMAPQAGLQLMGDAAPVCQFDCLVKVELGDFVMLPLACIRQWELSALRQLTVREGGMHEICASVCLLICVCLRVGLTGAQM